MLRHIRGILGKSGHKLAYIIWIGLLVYPLVSMADPFQQSPGIDGLVSIDAGSYHNKVAGEDHQWIEAYPEGHSGTSAVEASPNISNAYGPSLVAKSPRLDYQVKFIKAGTHYVWVRGIGANGQDDSLHIGLDGVVQSTSDNVEGFKPNWRWSRRTVGGVFATLEIATPGLHTINVWMREDGFIIDKIVITTDPDYIPQRDGPTESPERVVQQDCKSDGFISIGAENFHINNPGKLQDWIVTHIDGYSGTAALQALPNNTKNYGAGAVANSPRLDFMVDFVKMGTHYVWVRGFGANGDDDSLHIGLDGVVQSTSDNVEGFKPNWRWSRRTVGGVFATLEIATPGLHTINVWMREDGFIIDKLVVTTNPDYIPKGNGPDESQQGNEARTCESSVPLEITNTIPTGYTWDKLQPGIPVFIDRTFTYSDIPAAYLGLDVLQTANNDKSEAGDGFINFDVNQAVSVYIAFDRRIVENNSMPTWLASWTETGDEIVDTDTTRRLYKKNFAEGAVTLGGNEGERNSSMYTVLVSNGGGGVNFPPEITGAPTTSVDAGTLYNFEPLASDVNGDTLSFVIKPEKPSWAIFDSATGRLTGTPMRSDVGTYSNIEIGVTDGLETVFLSPFDITVSDPDAGRPIISNTYPIDYAWGRSEENGQVYVDQSDTYVEMPNAYVGLDVLQTAHRDINSSASDAITFAIDRPVTVYVAYDQTSSLPSWLGSWTNTGEEIVTTKTTLRTYKKDFAAGTVKLGGNEGAPNMYAVFVGPPAVVLTWTCPTTNVDGTPLLDLAGFRIYHGPAMGEFDSIIELKDPNICDENNLAIHVLRDLSPATYFFEVTAFDTSNNESKPSNSATTTIE